VSGRVLLVEDDTDLAYGVSLTLSREGWDVTHAATGPEGLRLIAEAAPEVVILDIGLPEMDGLAVCREARRQSAVPILLLTARSDEMDRVLGLELGGDDYLTKPFSIRELCARVRALHRRAAGGVVAAAADGGERRVTVHGLTIYPERRKVLRDDGSEVRLTNTEFALLLTLARRPGRVFSRQELMEAVWEDGHRYVVEHAVNVHLGHLREKVERDPSRPELILTVRGAGFKLREAAR
jgi:DNA-binding response OmpR family regulator